MSEESLRNKTVSGIMWSGVGRFGALALNFFSNLVLARLLMPEDYGTVGMLYVFIALSNEFVLAGFGAALIQKKNPTELDYTSVFWWNLAASLLFYGILFFAAPAIARFYTLPELVPILRWQSLSIVILAFTLVPSFWLQKQFRFRELSMRQLLASVVGAVVGIAMALLGFGVWSLVASNLVGSLAGVLLLWRVSGWRPQWAFSLSSLRELFKYGGLMALTSLMNAFYSNLQNLIIGKRYSASDLGYYTQAQKLENTPVVALAQIVNQVTFPLFSELQDDPERLRTAVKKNIQMSSYLLFPAMALLAVIAQPLITLLYGVKWVPAVPYFQLLCLYGMILPLNGINVNVFKSLGHSGIYFVSQLTMRVLGIALIFFAARFGIKGLLVAVVAMEYICLLINWGINRKIIGYGMAGQVRDIGGYYLLAILIAVAVWWLGGKLPLHPYLTMLVECVAYAVVYILVSKTMRLAGYAAARDIVMDKLCKKTL